jgi:hypothetical protein
MTQRGYYDPTQDSTPLPQMEVFPHGEAARKARRAFTYAAVIFGLAWFAAGAAFGETIQIGGVYINGQSASSTTTVTIEPSDQPGELAVVTFVNEYVNNGSNNGTYPLSMGDLLTVEVRFTWEDDPVTGADRIDLIVPPGVTCDPEDCGVTVEEGFTGTVVLFDWRGM